MVGETENQMSARTNILNRIRSGLKAKAPVPPAPKPGEVFPPLPSQDLISQFKKELEVLKGEFFQAPNLDEAQRWIKEIVEQNRFQQISAAPHEDVLKISSSISCVVPQSSNQYGSSLKNSDLAIT